MKRYTVTFGYTYEVKARTYAEALTTAEKHGVLVDGECFADEHDEEVE